MLARIFGAYAVAISENRWLPSVGMLVVALCLLGVPRLETNFGLLDFFGSGDRAVETLREYKSFWGADDAEVLIIATASEGTVLERDRLEDVAELAGALKREPWVEAVISLPTLPALAGPGRSAEISSVLDTLPDAPEDAAGSWRASLLADPSYVPFLLSEDGRHTVLWIRLAGDTDDLPYLRETTRRLESVLASQTIPGIELQATGVPIVRATALGILIRDQMVLAPAILTLACLLLVLIFRSLRAVFAAAVAAALPALMTLGVMGFASQPLGILNQIYFTLLPVLALSDAIHLIDGIQVSGASTPRAAVASSLRRVGPACLFSSLATGLALLSLLSAKIPLLREFGIFGAIGMAFALLSVILWVPLFMMQERESAPRASTPSGAGAWRRLADLFSTLACRHPAAVVLTTLALLAASFLGARGVVIDNSFSGLLPPDEPTVELNQLVDAKLGGLLSLAVDLRASEPVLKDEELIHRLGELESRLEALPAVRAVIGPGSSRDGVARLAEGLGLERPLLERAMGLLRKQVAPHLPKTTSRDHRRGRIVLRVRELDGRSFAQLAARVEEECVRALVGTGVAAQVTGTALVAFRGMSHLASDLRNGLFGAFVVVSLLLLVLLGSLRLGVLCLLPNLLPLAAGYQFMALMGWRLEPASAVMFTVAMGIAVDDTFHLIVKYRDYRSEGDAVSVKAAVRHAVHTAGKPMLFSSVVIAAGFLVNLLSSFPALVTFGSLGSVMVITALFADLLLLPALLVLAHR